MIQMSGRELSRAWQAVALASGQFDKAPLLYRTVHVEQFEHGLRLIATDAYWMAICWVPAEVDRDTGLPPEPGDDFATEPLLEEIPELTVTVRDDEYLVRDLMKHVARLTRKPTDPDVPILVDLSAAPVEEPAQPTLSPEMAPVRCRFEIPASLRVLASTVDGVYPTWRTLDNDFDTTTHDAIDPVDGVKVTIMSAWMLDRLSRVPRTIGAGTITLTWLSEHRARWHVTGETTVAAPPRGMFMAVRGPGTYTPTEDEPDDTDTTESAAVVQPEIPPAEPAGADPLYQTARRLVVDRQNASVRMVYETLQIGPVRARAIMEQLEQAGVVGPKIGGRREVLERWANE